MRHGVETHLAKQPFWRFGDGHEPLIRRSGVYFVKAQTVNAVETVTQDESEKSCVRAEDSQKWCVRAEDSQNRCVRAEDSQKIEAYEAEIHKNRWVRAEDSQNRSVRAENSQKSMRTSALREKNTLIFQERKKMGKKPWVPDDV